jgi:hypothetical protein
VRESLPVLLYRVVLIAALAVPLQIHNVPQGRLRVACQSIFGAALVATRDTALAHDAAKSQANGFRYTM